MLRRDDWTLIQEARERLGNTKLEWVKGHGNNLGNQKADQAARNALEESDARQLVNVEKEQFVLVVNGRIMETNLRQSTKQIHRKAGSILAKYPPSSRGAEGYQSSRKLHPSSKPVDLQLKVTDFVDFVKNTLFNIKSC
jgi:hypothetical protein